MFWQDAYLAIRKYPGSNTTSKFFWRLHTHTRNMRTNSRLSSISHYKSVVLIYMTTPSTDTKNRKEV
jgi:hypothetical protein